MINETFVAPDPKSAYELAVEKYGTSIKLLSAKQVKQEDGNLWAEISIAVSEENFMEQSVGATEVPESNEAEVALLEELKVLKTQLAIMKEEMLVSTGESMIERVKKLFMQKGVSEAWLDSVISTLMGSGLVDDEALLVSYLLEEMDETLEVLNESLDGPKIMMLVGPTGVGKTTTVAKLAARYAYLLDRPYKVALINLDSYKVGAFEQLAHYADIMQIEHITVDGIESFMHGLLELEDYDVILVDTAGMSPYDTQKLIKTVEYVQSDTPRRIEVDLVLSATVKYEDMYDIYNNFSFLNLNSVIISKFDETKHLGTLLNFMLLYKVPMSYFSIGQEVPDDLLVASKEYLLERFIGDFDKH
ncbi:flagellar biosynthesis protein FlhF [Sulfurovum sp.]|uniref:flagellar biosynthesis protein FlhF n=1 Tax=Sulfurovum sp. TaxID=1969726 RepID=UPI002867B73E|nr:flagellar biosynthesis protein FlhF [Sulfurovum sp.]